MSSAGISGGGGGGGGAPQQYFCYQCNRTVLITPSPSSDLVCPSCNGGFLEEYENPNPSPASNLDSLLGFSDNFSGLPSLVAGLGFSPFFPAPTSGDPQNPTDLSGLFGPGFRLRSSPTYLQEGPEAFNPLAFLQSYLQALRADGANIQFVIENSPGDTAFRLPANLGDYFIGPGLEQLIQQLAENDPNRYGTPPASKSAIDGLPDVKISEELLASDLAQCAVCKDTFELGSEAKQMPCKHIYHSDCILPWLKLHNSCPVCRYELPTDDPDYEQRRGGLGTGSSIGDGGPVDSGGGRAGQENNQPTTERSFRITLPSIFRAFASPAETSNSGVGTNNGSNGGDPNSGNRGNRDFGSETRQEDLG
ncbi:PREDICTED: E3 ubiquitin-protein ligase RING1-like [Nelumbo nucifera]|uniref:RING-type E3 ubiquitin transferase n=2 Tax=Nelumbo nucifera TaxID=4432 RepID=A0A822YV55_NELNU|nr:PREDICTED: E3 ubiquitin-protein ligase RING1-like [Nelumbo nucifera]DAD35973.1 TPA_asm: hypothetical protein HUJ06_006613 [Nelumbo nucifera]